MHIATSRSAKRPVLMEQFQIVTIVTTIGIPALNFKGNRAFKQFINHNHRFEMKNLDYNFFAASIRRLKFVNSKRVTSLNGIRWMNLAWQCERINEKGLRKGNGTY